MDTEGSKQTGEGVFAELSPLHFFSIYTVVQVQSLDRVGREIVGICASWRPNGESTEIVDFPRCYDLFWLWVLGSYEVIRTMKQHCPRCFSAAAQGRISVAYLKIKPIRIPFAKQENQNGSGPIYAENSVSGFGRGMKFRINGTLIDSTDLIEEILEFFNSFVRADVVGQIPTGPRDQ